jgi:hypothetical protein
MKAGWRAFIFLLRMAGLLVLFLPGWRLEIGDYSGIFIYSSFSTTGVFSRCG